VFFREGHNCWRVGQAGKVAFLVDGRNYFEAVAAACEKATRAIFIVGWDLDSRICLRRGNAKDAGETLGEFLDRLARETPGLHIYLLEWDFAMLYSLERETLPILSLGWKTHERVHFELDDNHPVGASHHQKIVVIDDRVAFVGGFDLASCRWDTSEHAPDHPDRRDNGDGYGPFHDVQMMVDGEAAKNLGELARRRWEAATGDTVPLVPATDHDPWPEEVAPDLENTSVATLRTQPDHDNWPEKREIETFYLEAIDRAQKWIYIENQYLTAHVIGSALEKVLRKEKGPEVLLVLPRNCSGWLEEGTMGLLRQHLVGNLRRVDREGRLKLCYPHRIDLGSNIINVHSKVLIVDDSILRIGSSNLSNRSMGFDTECDLALAAGNDETISKSIASFRNRLLAEHLGTDPQALAESIGENGSLLRAVENLNRNERSLRDLPVNDDDALSGTLSESELFDPERPIEMNRLLRYLGIGEERERELSRKSTVKHKAWIFAGVLGAALVMALLWRWSPLNEWLDIEHLLAAADYVRQSHLAALLVLAIFVLGSCLMFPVTLLILATALTYGPVLGFVLALAGSLLGGIASYGLGHLLGRDVVRRLAGRNLNRLSRKLARRGWLAIAIVRVLPIAPYTIVNMVAGSTHISARDFLIGTAIGMGPGIMAIMIFEGGFEKVVRDPGWGGVIILFMTLLAAGSILIFGKTWLTKKDDDEG